jgi:hypothetical protein
MAEIVPHHHERCSFYIRDVIGGSRAEPFASGVGAEGSRGRKRHAEGFGSEAESVREEGDRVVEADQRDQLEDLLDAERRRQLARELVRDCRGVVKLVDEPDQ